MEYGILVAVGEELAFQIVGAVASREEAEELAKSYELQGAENGYVAPYEFQIHRRGRSGGYTIVDHLRFA